MQGATQLTFHKAHLMAESDPASTRSQRMSELGDKTKKRNWRQTEKRSTTQLDDRFYDQVVIGPDLTKHKHKYKGSVIPDHLAVFDSDGIAMNIDDLENFRSVSHFEVVEDKNYQIEYKKGRNNLISKALEQIQERNALLSSFGATVHQTIRIDMSGHGQILLKEMEIYYKRLIETVPDNVDIELLLK